MKLRDPLLPDPRRYPVRFALSLLLAMYAALIASPVLLFVEHAEVGSTLPAALYFRDSLRMRYLMDHDGLSVDAVFTRTFDAATLDRDAMRWLTANMPRNRSDSLFAVEARALLCPLAA